MILDKYCYYETNNAYNFTPNFPSEVTRISVIKRASEGSPEVTVDRITSSSIHRLSEIEGLLYQVYEEWIACSQ